jgi:hypothetical protein
MEIGSLSQSGCFSYDGWILDEVARKSELFDLIRGQYNGRSCLDFHFGCSGV